MRASTNNPLEEVEQATLYQWLEYNKGRYPFLGWAYAIPNGGFRNVVVAVKLKAEGVKPGVPDFSIAEPRPNRKGLDIEMKRRKGGKVTTEQQAYNDYLKECGYTVAVCRGWIKAVNIVVAYFGLPEKMQIP